MKIVCVTGAAGQIAYSLVFKVARGELWDQPEELELRLLDIEPMQGKLAGVAMELEDIASPLVRAVVCTHEPAVAFRDADVVLMVGAMPRRPGMERRDLLAANAAIFREQGAVLGAVARPSVRVLVVGNPANTNAWIAQKAAAPKLGPECFSALTRLDANRAHSMVAKRLAVPVDQVRDVIIWGNHSKTQYPDVRHATVQGRPVRDAVGDDHWLETDFVTAVQNRGAAVMEARGLSSAASAAQAIVDHMHDWLGGSRGRIVSMAILSEGNLYDVPKDLMFSMPCRIDEKGTVSVVPDLIIDDFSRKMLNITAEELQSEQKDVVQLK